MLDDVRVCVDGLVNTHKTFHRDVLKPRLAAGLGVDYVQRSALSVRQILTNADRLSRQGGPGVHIPHTSYRDVAALHSCLCGLLDTSIEEGCADDIQAILEEAAKLVEGYYDQVGKGQFDVGIDSALRVSEVSRVNE